jgi:glycerol kinase
VTDPLVLSIDQGTSSTKCLLVDATGSVVARASAPLGIDYPLPGWVEQSADEIWTSVQQAVGSVLSKHDASRVAAVGLSTQRESVLLWDTRTGRPVGPMLSWQDQRTAAECELLRNDGSGDLVRQISGLPLDPMFSAMKARWLLDQHDPDRTRSARGELCVGTVDSWLAWQLVGRHTIEVGNASRTQLLDVRTRSWSTRLLELFAVPAEALPELVPSAEPLGSIHGIAALSGVPLTAVLADSHAALYGHGVRTSGSVKATFGTGSSVMALVDSADQVGEQLCLTIAWEDGTPVYAAEGNIRASGAAIVWAAGLLGMKPHEFLELASVSESGGVDVVPAFGGLAAPWWDDLAVGVVSGLTLGSGPGQLARAVVEAVTLQVRDVVAAISACTGPVERLLVDGGATANDALMQLQADLAQLPVHRPNTADLSALGAAHLAGLATGVWDEATLQGVPRYGDGFTPQLDRDAAAKRVARWHSALDRSRYRGPKPVLTTGSRSGGPVDDRGEPRQH